MRVAKLLKFTAFMTNVCESTAMQTFGGTAATFSIT